MSARGNNAAVGIALRMPACRPRWPPRSCGPPATNPTAHTLARKYIRDTAPPIGGDRLSPSVSDHVPPVNSPLARSAAAPTALSARPTARASRSPSPESGRPRGGSRASAADAGQAPAPRRGNRSGSSPGTRAARGESAQRESTRPESAEFGVGAGGVGAVGVGAVGVGAGGVGTAARGPPPTRGRARSGWLAATR